MAEGTYEYECMRAELLGIDRPNYEAFLQKQQSETQAEAGDEELARLDEENLKVVDDEGVTLKRVSGRLDELNSLLQSTQSRLNRFKVSCGSLTERLRFRIGQSTSVDGGAAAATTGSSSDSSGGDVGSAANGNARVDAVVMQRQSDLTQALDNNVDRLDSLIDKAENAQYRMSEQDRQVKKFLK